MADAILTVLQHRDTGLYHGACLVNCPTPSGCERWITRFTTATGRDCPQDAVQDIATAFPDLPAPVVPEAMAIEAEAASRTILPPGAVLTVITPQPGRVMEAGVTPVEVTVNGVPAGIVVTMEDFQALRRARKIELESTSGCDPNLHYRYDHYVAA